MKLEAEAQKMDVLTVYIKVVDRTEEISFRTEAS